MTIFYNKIIPPKGWDAINICGFLFVRNGVIISDRLINHENIHTNQIKELGYIFFYILYVLEFIFRFIQYKNWVKAYYNISFEREAFDNQYNYMYLSNRKLYSWFKYITYKPFINI